MGSYASSATRSPLADFDDARSSRGRRGWVVALVVVLVLLAAYAAAAWYLGDRVPRGASVAGVDVGGLSSAEARDRLEEDLVPAADAPVPVLLGETETTLDPAAAGLGLDVDATVSELTGLSFDPRDLIGHVFGAGEEDPVTTVDEEALRAALTQVSDVVSTAPVEGAIALTEGTAVVTEPVSGTTLDVDGAAEVVAADWLLGSRPLTLPGTEVPPVIGPDAVATAMAEIAGPLTGAPASVEIDGRLVELTVEDLTSLAAIVPDGERLDLTIDGEALVALLKERDPDLATAGQDARIVLTEGVPTIIPSATGLGIDEEALVDAVRGAATSTSDRTAVVALIETEPEFTTADAEALGVREVISSFSTPYFNDPARTQNLVVGAEKINNTLVKPGETFSLIEALGPITAERGFGASGVVVDGLETTGMGGGLSQISATTFNAAYFAGMEIVTHQPHSHHYARYPEGREATIYTPSVDMVWRNTTEYGALVQAWVADGEVHVRLWGTPYFEVRSSTSERFNLTQPTTVYNTGENCVPHNSPEPGFTVRVNRTVLREGEVVAENEWTTRYIPWDRVVCGPAPG